MNPLPAGFRTLCLLAALAPAAVGCSRPSPPTVELRGVWLTNVDSHVLERRENIRDAMEFLAAHNFNAVFPVVWNKGMTLYPSQVMDSLFGVGMDTLYRGRDPLQEVIEEAHARSIAVIPWFEFGFAASYNASGGHILAARPYWAARDREGNLLTKNGFEWMNAYHPEVQALILSLVLEVVRTYPVEGVQGDDRLPAQPVEGGYCRYTQHLYARAHEGRLPPEDFRDTSWVRWRAERLTEFAGRLYREVKTAKPDVLVSWAPSIHPWGLDEYLQDWPSWVRSGYADLVIPQMYRYSADEYRQLVESQSSDSLNLGGRAEMVIPGMLIKLGDYLVDDDYLRQALRFNRARGYHGEVFFFYEGLRMDHDRIGTILLREFYASSARLPFPTTFQAHATR